MSELQDTINRIMSDPEAVRQMQSLGAQLGLTGQQSAQGLAVEPKPEPVKPAPQSADILGSVASLAPLMQSFSADDEVTNLLNALKPFLGEEKLKRLNQAQRIMRLVRMIPLIKDSGLFL